MNAYVYIVLAGISLLCGCASNQGEKFSERSIVGKWESDVAPSEWGQAKTELDFGMDGTVRFRTMFIEDSPPRELTHEGRYQLRGNALTSDAMNRGKPLRAWFDKGDLMLQIDDEAPGRYHRVK